MAAEKPKKSKKKLRHTQLVLPQEHVEEKQKDREHRGGGRIQRAFSKTKYTSSADAENKVVSHNKEADASGQNEAEKKLEDTQKNRKQNSLPPNAIVMPRKNQRILNLRRKKFRKRLLLLGVFFLLAFGIWLYASGNYLYVSLRVRDLIDSAQVAMMPADGFPIQYSVPGYVQSEGMGNGGFASLGESDLVIFSAAGEELRRVQHGLANPDLSTGDTRVCVYSRGGTGYIVESRSERLVQRTTEDDILFIETGSNGSLMVVTSSRYRADVQIFSPLYHVEPSFSWELVDEKPVAGVFSSNNEDFALACVASEAGALGTTIYWLNSGQDEPQAVIHATDASLITLEYLSQNSLLAMYDSYAALYNSRGEETARYEYGGRSLLTADVGEGRAALVFGSQGREDIDVVLLRDSLQAVFEVKVFGQGQARVLSVTEGVFVLFGQQVSAFDLRGSLVQDKTIVEKPLDLVQAREPLLLTVSSAESLQPMFDAVQTTEQSSE